MSPTRSTINTVTLTCSNCGSGLFTKVAQNEYQCKHCGALTLVEDDVAERLEKLLRGLTAPAARPALTKQQLMLLAVVLPLLLISVLLISFVGNKRAGPATPLMERKLDASLVTLSEPQEVASGSRKKLLVMMRNGTGATINAPRVTAEFYDGELTVDSEWSDATLRTLLPGESTPVLLSLPSKPTTRHSLSIGEPRRDAVHANRIKTSKVTLVAEDNRHRLIGLMENEGDTRSGLVQIVVWLLADDGKVVGLGSGYARVSPMAPGAKTLFDVGIERLTDEPAVAYEYVVNVDPSHQPGEELGPLLTSARTVRVEPPAARPSGELRLSAEELLDDSFRLFDPADLHMAKPRTLADEIDRPLLLTQVTNTSTEWTVIAPVARPTFMEGAKTLSLRPSWSLPSRLYPGESVPMLYEGSFDRVTEFSPDWKAARRAGSDATRPRLRVQIDETSTHTGTGTLNFRYRYSYKYVDVRGRVFNDGERVVQRPSMWISMLDRQQALTGAAFHQPDVKAIKPGESAPFKVSVKQYGGAAADVRTLVEAAIAD